MTYLEERLLTALGLIHLLSLHNCADRHTVTEVMRFVGLNDEDLARLYRISNQLLMEG